MTELTSSSLIKLTSAPDATTNQRETRCLPSYIAVQSPTLALILEAGFLEAQTNSITLDSITPDALRQCVTFLRDSNSTPELESVIETLYAAKYLELDRLVESCCKLIAKHYNDLPKHTLQYFSNEFVLRICRRLNPLQLCQAEIYIQKLKTRKKLWSRLERKLKLSTSITIHAKNNVLAFCLERLIGVAKVSSSDVSALDDGDSYREWSGHIRRLAPYVSSFCLRNPTLSLQRLSFLLFNLKLCQLIDLSRSLRGKSCWQCVVDVFKKRMLHGLDMSECGMTAQSVQYLCMGSSSNGSNGGNGGNGGGGSGSGSIRNAKQHPRFSICNNNSKNNSKNRTSNKTAACLAATSLYSPMRPSPKKRQLQWNVIQSGVHIHQTGRPSSILRTTNATSFPSSTSPRRPSLHVASKYSPRKMQSHHFQLHLPQPSTSTPSLHLKVHKNPSLGSSCSLSTSMLLKRSLHTLTILSLSSNPNIQKEGARILSEWMISTATKKTLTSLNMSKCKLDASGIIHLLNAVNACKSMAYLDVSNNIVDGRSNISMIEALHECLDNNKTLTYLNLSENALWETELDVISHALSMHPTLISLNLSKTNLRNVAPFIHTLSSNNCVLSVLNISRNELSANQTAFFFDPKLTDIKNKIHNKIQESNPSIVSRIVPRIISGKRKFHGLLSLELNGNVVNDKVAFLIGTYLDESTYSVPTLKTLNMRRKRNNIESTGSRHHQDVHLDAVTCQGFVAILNGAQHNTTLTALDLSGHHIRNAGVIKLSEVLFDTRLIKINLSHNRIGDRGVTPLALQLRTRVEERSVLVELVGNPISREIAALVR